MICWTYKTGHYNSMSERDTILTLNGDQGYELVTELSFGLARGMLTFKKPVKVDCAETDFHVSELRDRKRGL